MEACEVVRLFVNKAIVPIVPKRLGNPGYGGEKRMPNFSNASFSEFDQSLLTLFFLSMLSKN